MRERKGKIAKKEYKPHTTVRNVLRDNGVLSGGGNSKTILAGKSRDPEYDMKKKSIILKS
jgi:hypothetical protein